MPTIGGSTDCPSSSSGGINYPQAVGRLVLETGAVMIIYPGSTYIIQPGYTLNQSTIVASNSTLEIKV